MLAKSMWPPDRRTIPYAAAALTFLLCDIISNLEDEVRRPFSFPCCIAQILGACPVRSYTSGCEGYGFGKLRQITQLVLSAQWGFVKALYLMSRYYALGLVT